MLPRLMQFLSYTAKQWGSDMAGSVNKVIEDAILRYVQGESIPQVADSIGMPRSSFRYRLQKVGALRGRAEGVRLAARDGRLGGGFRGKAREFSPEHCANISDARQRWADRNSSGVSLKPSGYLEYTRGPHKGRHVHVVKMEERLGRALLEDECVHHIDSDKTNNADNNLALVTISGHGRLHRREDMLTGNTRERREDGRFC